MKTLVDFPLVESQDDFTKNIQAIITVACVNYITDCNNQSPELIEMLDLYNGVYKDCQEFIKNTSQSIDKELFTFHLERSGLLTELGYDPDYICFTQLKEFTQQLVENCGEDYYEIFSIAERYRIQSTNTFATTQLMKEENMHNLYDYKSESFIRNGLRYSTHEQFVADGITHEEHKDFVVIDYLQDQLNELVIARGVNTLFKLICEYNDAVETKGSIHKIVSCINKLYV